MKIKTNQEENTSNMLEALLKLEQISKMSANEAPSFEAKMILKVWREKGSLTF